MVEMRNFVTAAMIFAMQVSSIQVIYKCYSSVYNIIIYYISGPVMSLIILLSSHLVL